MKTKIGPILAGLMLASSLSSLNQSVLAPAIPTLVGELGGVSLMLWVLGTYFLFSTISMPIYGKIGDLIGRKSLLIIAISIFMVGSTIGALAQNMPMIIVARSVQGLGGGGLLILSQAALADVAPARERGKYMGILAGVIAVSSVAGPLIGGWLAEGPGWRWAFWSALPVGVIALIACAFFLPTIKLSNAQPLDWFGMLILALGTGCLVLAVTWGGSKFDWLHPVTLSLLGGVLIFTVVFILIERRAVEPIIPLPLFGQRNFNLATAAALIVAVAMFAVMGYLPTYLQMVHGVSATVSGLLMMPMMVTLVITSTIVGGLISRRGNYKWYPVIGTAMIATAMALLSTLSPGQSLWLVVSYLALMGLGLGHTMQIFVVIVQGTFPDKIVGTATASNNFFRQIGATLGSSVVGSLFATRLSLLSSEKLTATQISQIGSLDSLTPNQMVNLPAEIRAPLTFAYSESLTPIFLWLAPLVLVACLLLFFLKNTPLAAKLDRETSDETAVLP